MDNLLFIIFAFLLFSASVASASHSIHIEWGYTPPSEPDITGFTLYQFGQPVCSTSNPDATSMDCEVNLVQEVTDFTLTANFSDGSESPHSAPFPFSISISDPPIQRDKDLKLHTIEVE